MCTTTTPTNGLYYDINQIYRFEWLRDKTKKNIYVTLHLKLLRTIRIKYIPCESQVVTIN